MRAPCRAAAARIPLSSSRPVSQHELHAVPGDLDSATRELGALAGVFVEYRIGVVHVYQDLARAGRQLLQPLQHAARAALRQGTDIARAGEPESDAYQHFVRPERADPPPTGGRLTGVASRLLPSA